MTEQLRTDILTGKICPYCVKPTELVDSSIIYQKSFGMIYLCRPCKAWVGTHSDNLTALGRLANEELREAKKEAHRYFDELWQRKVKQGNFRHVARGAAYKWLAGQMGIEVKNCHIGMMDVKQCRKVVEICKPYCIKSGENG